jgi:serine dehydrogenase proteinase
MGTWGELREELAHTQPDPKEELLPQGVLRRKYVGALSEYTGRDTFIYYSGWMNGGNVQQGLSSLVLADIAGFMEACSQTKSRELDLVIHSPGGEADAVEQISEYLRTQFDHIRAIVPVAAMSAATMLALSTDEVVMGAHSQLGPIDPQITMMTSEGPRTASAQAIRDQFTMAKKECANPKLMAAWMPLLRMIGPGLLASCDHSAKRAEQIVEKAMAQYMLASSTSAQKKAKAAARWFGDAKKFLSHGRPVRRDEAREHDVVVSDLEDDQKLQDLVLSVHHATSLSMGQGGAGIAKLIETGQRKRWMQVAAQIVIGPAPGGGPGQPGGPMQPGGPFQPPRGKPRKRRH